METRDVTLYRPVWAASHFTPPPVRDKTIMADLTLRKGIRPVYGDSSVPRPRTGLTVVEGSRTIGIGLFFGPRPDFRTSTGKTEITKLFADLLPTGAGDGHASGK